MGIDPNALEPIGKKRQEHLTELITFARTNSPYYRELYSELPEEIEELSLLPITNKKNLMEHYDDWATDRDVTLEKVRAFLNDPTLIGKRFLGKYRVAMTSGSTGMRMIFVTDERADLITETLSKQMFMSWFGSDIDPEILQRGRMAVVIATGGHTSAFSRSVRLADINPDEKRKVFSVHAPLPELVSQLNEYQPAILQGYASTISLLAYEQDADRLRINPVLVIPTSEGLADRDYDRIERSFNSKVGIFFGGTECGGAVAWSCDYRSLHLNSDWVIVEPVDANFNPTERGEQSYTVLITNLANRIEPIIRYDMGDSILVRPDSCPCGNPMPVIRVLGRVADIVTFGSKESGEIKITALQFSMIFDRISEVQLFQIVQTDSTTLLVRVRTIEGVNRDQVWKKIYDQISELLRNNKLDYVKVERASEPPEQTPGGKYREVLPLS
jgi:phenylacetate-CoA ligase